MKLSDLINEANKKEKLSSTGFANWLIDNNRVNDLIAVLKSDRVMAIELRKKYCGRQSIDRLENSEFFVNFATFFATLGHIKESEQIFNNLLALTPDDTSALNNYGFMLLNEMVKDYKTEKKYDKNKIDLAESKISKAATIDKYLHEEPLILPAYKNLSLLRAVNATYYIEEKANLPAFLLAWMSIEMTIYRIWYSHLRENHYSKEKTDELARWTVDTIIEVLFLNKCDAKFIELKAELDSLKNIRNHLLHGKTFEISEAEAKRCVDVALMLIPIKQDIATHLDY